MSATNPGEGGADTVDGDLARLGLRTSLMTLNLLLSAVPAAAAGFADAAAEARCLSLRAARATDDFSEAMRRVG